FNSFFNGRTTTYFLVALSIVRYTTTASSSISANLQQKLEQHTLVLVLVCLVISAV
ncbi:unnamed protein product, partial [Rotaria magnacalcarata]